MGGFVDKIKYRHIGVGNPWNEITETVDYTRAYADQMRDALSNELENLKSVVGTYHPDFGRISSSIPSLSKPSFPSPPNINTELNDNWPDINIPDPVLKDISADFSYTDPVDPGDIDIDFDYSPGVYSSCIWDALCEKIKNGLLNGGTGLTDAVYAAIIDRNKEARRNAEDQARQKLVNTIGSRGFDLPGGMMAAAIVEFEKDIMAKDIDAVNNVTIKDFEMADANERFIKEIAVNIEGMLRNDFSDSENRLLDIAKTAKGYIVSVYEQKVKKYVASWDGVRAKIESAKSQIEAISSENESKIKAFLGRTEVLKSRIMAISSENESKEKLALYKSHIYEAKVRAISTEFSALVEEIKVAMDRYKTDVDAAISREELNLKAFSSSAALAESVSEAISKIAAQSVASALGAIQTSMSYGYRGSTSKSENSNLSNSLSEQHAYKEE